MPSMPRARSPSGEGLEPPTSRQDIVELPPPPRFGLHLQLQFQPEQPDLLLEQTTHWHDVLLFCQPAPEASSQGTHDTSGWEV